MNLPWPGHDRRTRNSTVPAGWGAKSGHVTTPLDGGGAGDALCDEDRELSSDDCEVVPAGGRPGDLPCSPVGASDPGAPADACAVGGVPDGGSHAPPAARSAHDVLMRAQRGRPAAAPGPTGNAFQQMMQASVRQGRGGGQSGAGARLGAAPWVRCRGGGAVRVLEVPYSEHSSCAELQEFVAWLRPHAVVPTVGGGRDATPRMLRVLAGMPTPADA